MLAQWTTSEPPKAQNSPAGLFVCFDIVLAMRPPRHPDWWHSWHRDSMLIGIAILAAGLLLGFLAIKKRGWVRWTVAPVTLLEFWIGSLFVYYALGGY